MKYSLTPCYLLLAFVLSPSILHSQKSTSTQLNQLTKDYVKTSLSEFRECLSIPNDAHFPDQVEANVKWCENAFGKRGFSTQRLTTAGPPLLLAERKVKKPQKTVLIYLQIDGQPVDSSRWLQPNPYQPVLKAQKNGRWEIIPWDRLDQGWSDDWRIFARSASDAKGPVAMFLGAIDLIDQNKVSPSYNIKVIMDFEEELGSPHLPGAVETYREALKADLLIILDGPRHISNQPTLTFGARGITTITLTLFGPRAPQHSGHYGNYAPNPAFRLTQLIGSMKDEDGRVILPGFYDGIVLDQETMDILESVPDNEEQIRKSVGIAGIDKVGTSYQTAIQYPSLNLRGIRSGWVGSEVRTIVPATATAEIDIRLPLEANSDRLVKLVRDHISSKGYHIIEGEPTEAERMKYDLIISFTSRHEYDAFRTEFQSEPGQWLYRALKRAFDKEPIRIRTSGGSIPISPFVTTLGIPAVTVPTVNRDNNQHSPNENIRLGNYREGMMTFLAILTEGF
ncbi:MAG: M20/M25/M40 family metallo-hydrolase [Bacteroidetes bacterium]|nr:M20/M25/M40 family metallo-hydrolase [Bacteroidota bacterium]MCB0843563.1 M20/M25/M40 family metallo-hydrolase [Bacteroidota bacterium]MCB0855950.1 M20/M25/M40 family metallo-hydrolase [Bacteroidota bacterium]